METTEVIKKEVSKVTAKNSPTINNDEVANATPKEPDSVPVVESIQEQSSAATSTKARNTKEEKMRKKDDKSVDHVLKALNSLNTTEEKLAAMCKKYADLFDESRKVQLALKQSEKKSSNLQREKEQLQTDHTKAILTRSRLENLCRELQRQNKVIKDESLLKIREEEEKRKEVSGKFQATLNEITALMQQNNDKNLKLRDDNIDMTARLKSVCEQYEVREQQVEKINKQMQLETQLADAKLAKAKMEMAADREMMLRDKQQLLLELSQYQTRCQEFQATEINLRNQISMYDDKYDEFQKALARSNEVFGGFKGEMGKMSKKMCKLEKEVSTWKQRWEGSHKALLDMAEDKQKSDLELGHSKRQLLTLEGLCRTLQGERASLLAKIKQEQNSTDSNNTSRANTVASVGESSAIVENSSTEPSHVDGNIGGDVVKETKDEGPCQPALETSKIKTVDGDNNNSSLNSQQEDINSKVEVVASINNNSLPENKVESQPVTTTTELIAEVCASNLISSENAAGKPVDTEQQPNTATTSDVNQPEVICSVDNTSKGTIDTAIVTEPPATICNGNIQEIKQETPTLQPEIKQKVNDRGTAAKDGVSKENTGKKLNNEGKRGKESKKKKKNT